MVKNLPPDAGDVSDTGSIPGLGRCPGGGNGNPLQSSCMDNPMDRGHQQLEPRGSLTKSRTGLKQLSMHAQTCARATRPSASVLGRALTPRLTKASRNPESKAVCCERPLLQTWEVLAGAGGALPPRPKPLPPAGPGGLFSLLEHLLSVLT